MSLPRLIWSDPCRRFGSSPPSGDSGGDPGGDFRVTPVADSALGLQVEPISVALIHPDVASETHLE